MSEPENTSHQVVARDEHGRYLPGGRSPNPGGRTPVVAEVKELARAHTPDAIGTLVTIMRSTKAPAAARVSAASVLLDRAYGRPQQAVALSPSSSMGLSGPVRPATNALEAAEIYSRVILGHVSVEDAVAALERPEAPVMADSSTLAEPTAVEAARIPLEAPDLPALSPPISTIEAPAPSPAAVLCEDDLREQSLPPEVELARAGWYAERAATRRGRS